MTTSFAEGLIGLTLDDRYRLDAVLGEGGMGAVFRATHLAMDRKVAVKLLKPHLANDEASLQRFAREARSTMKVDSPHAVKVLDYGVTPRRDYYMVLEYLDGRTVQRELDIDGVFAPSRMVHITRQALHALGAAHATGLIHRDIKPENILLMRVGADADYTKLLDFGVAKLMEGAAKSDRSQLALTQHGTVFGTPEFMSPEQACGHALDGRSDLYSLAATMFAMLTGCALFEAGSAIEWLTHHVRTPPPHLADIRPELVAYPELDELLQRCLAKHREQRPRDAAELGQLLAALEPRSGEGQDGKARAQLEPVLARPPGTAPSPSSKVRVFSSSTFFPALPGDSVELGTILPPAAANGSAAVTKDEGTRSSSTSAIMAASRPRRRGLYLGLGALAMLGLVSVAIGLAASRRTSRTGSISSPDAVVAVVAVDAASLPAIDAIAAEVIVDAAADRAPGDAATRSVPVARISEAAMHLRNAEEALRSNHLMKQLAEADLALRADAHNSRARYLLGDALIKYGNLDKGCSYLRGIARYPLARSRAASAGCP
ncbi:MAG: serine/threonine protein kinase [Deltaproteobacteria bacterium]|nr:serine/threonine protein kinase [Deltaproteobacteria bacterium]